MFVCKLYLCCINTRLYVCQPYLNKINMQFTLLYAKQYLSKPNRKNRYNLFTHRISSVNSFFVKTV